MTDIDLEEIKGRLAAATPGHWMHGHRHEAHWVDTKPDLTVLEICDVDSETAYADAELITNAPADIAALIAEVERLQAQIGVVRTLHEPIEALNTTVNRVQKVCLGCGQDNGNWQNWPCPTTRALEDPAATHAGYTSHGHPIAGLKQSGKPSSVMRCGGPSICARCALEASRATRSEAQHG